MTWNASDNEPRCRKLNVLGRTITAQGTWLGPDLLVTVTGGDAPHIGAAALAEPYQKGERNSVCASVVSAYGHREAELAQSIATALAKQYRVRVSVICGIHFEKIDPKHIPEIAQSALNLALSL